MTSERIASWCRSFARLRPDLVHTHSTKAGFVGRWAAHTAGVPTIIHTIHGLSFTAATVPAVNALYRHLERRAARVCSKIVCVADAMRDASLAVRIGRPDQYATVYSGMAVEGYLAARRARERTRHRLKLAPDHVAVGTIARMASREGHEDILSFAPALCARFPNVRFSGWVTGSSERNSRRESDR